MKTEKTNAVFECKDRPADDSTVTVFWGNSFSGSPYFCTRWGMVKNCFKGFPFVFDDATGGYKILCNAEDFGAARSAVAITKKQVYNHARKINSQRGGSDYLFDGDGRFEAKQTRCGVTATWFDAVLGKYRKTELVGVWLSNS